ncbi:MAG: hypothetical protein C4519_11720 [Desulfobacteraceae bacterium]|nr:MAG: hypothetical protein C4519_11720 [Desulfobacteraceae bacterium]
MQMILMFISMKRRKNITFKLLWRWMKSRYSVAFCNIFLQQKLFRNCLWLLYILYALFTLFIWTKNNWFPVTGDEPHYIVMADGIIRDGTFEQTKAYAREFKDRKIYPTGLAPHGDHPNAQNTHAIVGPNGLYNIHNIGLPIVIFMPYVIAGTLGAKVFIVLLCSFLIPMVWRLSNLYTNNINHKVLIAVSLCFSAAVIPASTQIYPDLLGGVIALAACTRLLERQEKEIPFGMRDIGIAITVSFLPWLQIKFTAAAIILSIAIALQFYFCDKGRYLGILCLIILSFSLVSLGIYNIYAFGKFTGPYNSGALKLSSHSLMVFLGLHIDRFQGIFIQNPIYFVGLIFIIPYLKRNRFVGTIILLVYCSFIIPNALHPNWYGGFSFAGRFAWAGAIVMMPIVAYALSVLMTDTKKGHFALIFIIFINALFYTSYTSHRFDFYNKAFTQADAKNIFLNQYDSLFPLIDNFLPALYDSDWAFEYIMNIDFLIFVFGLMTLGYFYTKLSNPVFYSKLKQFLFTFCVFTISAGATNFEHRIPMFWEASKLPSQVGEIKGGTRVVLSHTSLPGFVTFGPYIPLKEGKYNFTYLIEAFSSDDEIIGWADVYNHDKRTLLTKIDIKSSDKPQTIEGRFEIFSDLSMLPIEVRIFYTGKGNIIVHSLQLYSE